MNASAAGIFPGMKPLEVRLLEAWQECGNINNSSLIC